MKVFRTDIAAEAHQLWRDSADKTAQLPGVIAESRTEHGYFLECVEITTEEGSEALGKPKGIYITLGLDVILQRETGAFADGAELFKQLLKPMLGDCGSVLVVGLGNGAITSDSLGPLTAERILVTRRLNDSHNQEGMRSVAVLQTGVAGTTGLESGELVKSVVDFVKPDCIIAVDALASAKLERVCRTLQLADSGISPGSGIGNTRKELTKATLGVPVIAAGIPTIAHPETLFGDNVPEEALCMVVTPKDIDAKMKELSRFLACGINLALHDTLNITDLQEFLA